MSSSAAGPAGLAQAPLVLQVPVVQRRRRGAVVGELWGLLLVSHPQKVLLLLQVVAAAVPLRGQVDRVLLQRHPGVERVGGHGGHGAHGARVCQTVVEVRGWRGGGRGSRVAVGLQGCGHGHGSVAVLLGRPVADALLQAFPAEVVELQHGQQERHAGHHQHKDDEDVLLRGARHVAVYGVGAGPRLAEVQRPEEHPVDQILHHDEDHLHGCPDHDAQDVRLQQGAL